MIDYTHPFWRTRAFRLAQEGALAFILLTLIAMFLYPGGSLTDPTTRGYSFFENFFSELGFLVTQSGAVNLYAAPLFFIALNLAGASLVLFFLAFPQFFLARPLTRRLGTAGSLFGIAAGLCFIGVAFTPADVFLFAHYQFVFWAFRLFPLAVLYYAAAIFLHPTYPRRAGWLFAAFWPCLVAYLLLLEFGPSATGTYAGQVIQATGQKLIVYLSIATVLVQSRWVPNPKGL